VVFGLRSSVSGETATRIYDEIVEKLKSREFRPRALFERFNIEVLATTDGDRQPRAPLRDPRVWLEGPSDPTFRPDAQVQDFRRPSFDPLGASDYAGLVRAIAERRAYFKQLGATATDHAVLEPYTAALSEEEVERLFQRARQGDVAAHVGTEALEDAAVVVAQRAGMDLQSPGRRPATSRHFHQ